MGLGTLRQQALYYASLIFGRDDPLWSWLRKEITGIVDHQQLKDFEVSFKKLAKMLDDQKVLLERKDWADWIEECKNRPARSDRDEIF